MEIERRYKLDDTQYERVLSAFDWSTPSRVCDLTMGPSGPTSMLTDGWVVRLRIIGDTGDAVSMDYKAPQNAEWTSWVEYSTRVESFGETVQILRGTGLREGLLLDRERRTANYDDLILSLDDLAGLGRFLEIEAQADEGEEAHALALVDRARESLGISNEQEARPYGDLMLKRLESDPEFEAEHARLVQSRVSTFALSTPTEN